MQMVQVTDGCWRVRLNRTAVASYHSSYDPSCLSFLCQCLFGLFGSGFLNILFSGKTRRKGGLASWQMRQSLRERGKNRGNHTLLNFNGGLEILWLYT